MSEIERKVPGTPYITKIASTLDKEPDVRAGINYVNRMDKVRKQAIEAKEEEVTEIEETPIVTPQDIKDDMYR